MLSVSDMRVHLGHTVKFVNDASDRLHQEMSSLSNSLHHKTDNFVNLETSVLHELSNTIFQAVHGDHTPVTALSNAVFAKLDSLDKSGHSEMLRRAARTASCEQEFLANLYKAYRSPPTVD